MLVGVKFEVVKVGILTGKEVSCAIKLKFGESFSQVGRKFSRVRYKDLEEGKV